ncbi:MAG: anti-sigma F factor antagonist [Firmicutes bacterium]|nr:anti-sigma F factor antagonist [Bacillota bacterium]
MEIIYEISQDALIAELFGEMDHHSAEKIRTDIDGMIEEYGSKNLIFDFGRVTFMDSSGIGIVLGRYKKRQAEGGKVVIVDCEPRIRNILNMAGIFSLMKYMDTKEEALDYLQRKEVS